MISPIRYDVEIHEPLSTPVPMPPSISSREALVIWMFRIAMNEPIMAARMAIQVMVLARSDDGATCLAVVLEVGDTAIEFGIAGLEIGRDMGRPLGVV